MDTLPDCFRYVPGAFADITHQEVDKALEWEQKMLTMYGKTFPLPRLTAMYGAAYNYSGVQHPSKPLPALLERLRARVEEVSGLTGFNSVLGNSYRDGSDSVSWHSDDDYNTLPGLPHIASLSFGGTRRFRIRSKADKSIKFHVDLGHGDLLLMTGRSQLDWMHCVPKTSREVPPRINLTFRCMEGA